MSCPNFKNCPLRRFEKEKKISNKWKNKFCGTDNNWLNCIRYQETAKGIAHPDNKMPDGTIYKNLN